MKLTTPLMQTLQFPCVPTFFIQMKIVLYICVFLVLDLTHLNAQAADVYNKWNEVIKTKELPDIAKLIEHSNGLPWPKLVSDASYSLSAKTAFKPSDFGNALLNKIQNYEINASHKPTDLVSSAAVYGSLSRGLQNSGGYINLCLANTANSMAIAKLFEALINDPSDIVEVKAQYANLTCVRFDTPKFARMILDEPAQKLKTSIDLTTLKDSDAKEKILIATGTDEADMITKSALGKLQTSNLIIGLQIGCLCEYMAETDIIAAHLGFLIDFLEHGGKYSDLNMQDARRFYEIMGDRDSLYNSDVENTHVTGVIDILPLISMFKNSNNSDFVKRALQ